MKKLALTSLLAVFAVSGAHAANVIDGNPLYLPGAGHFYSVSTLGSHTEGTPYLLGEEFGYGITNKLAVEVSTALWENKAFDVFAWDNVALKATYRALDLGAWKLDLVGAYEAGSDAIGGGGLYVHNNKNPHLNKWFDKDFTGYTWTAGVRGGYTTSTWTLAGHAMFNYLNSETFNWGDKGTRVWELGLDAQYVLDSHWSLLAGVEYTGITQDHVAYDDVEDPNKTKNAGSWYGEFGVNYNIDATKFVGVYVSADMDHDGGHDHDEWHVEKGFGFGAKFGIDF